MADGKRPIVPLPSAERTEAVSAQSESTIVISNVISEDIAGVPLSVAVIIHIAGLLCAAVNKGVQDQDNGSVVILKKAIFFSNVLVHFCKSSSKVIKEIFLFTA